MSSELSTEQINMLIKTFASMQSEFVQEDPRYIALSVAIALAEERKYSEMN